MMFFCKNATGVAQQAVNLRIQITVNEQSSSLTTSISSEAKFFADRLVLRGLTLLITLF